MTVTEPPPAGGPTVGQNGSVTSAGAETPPVTAQPTTLNGGLITPAAPEPKRRVSIASDPVSETRIGTGYDNYGYGDLGSRRKISQSSEPTELPARKKSILVNNTNNTNYINAIQNDNESVISHYSHDFKQNGDTRTRNYINSQIDKENQPNNSSNKSLEESWIFALCMRCRVEYNTPSWEPPHWQKVCPFPLCPSYRQFANILSIVLIGLLLWVTVYVIIGDTAAPGGQVFGLVVLTVAANFGGWLISLTRLPGLIGMLLVGILFQNVGWVNLDGEFSEVTAQLRKIALTIILIRAGLEMDPVAFKKVYKTILKLGLVPWCVETIVIGISTHFLLALPWIWAFALGSIIAAVSPAVVVPCLYRLRTKGYGVAKGIPTLIIAVAGIDDAASVAVFGIISSMMFSSGGLGYQIAQAPVCIFGGLIFAVIWGYLSRFVPEKGDSYVVPIRTLMLLGGGLLAIFGSEKLHFEGAGPLGVVFAAFISNYFWCQQGWEIEDNPVATAFEIFWMIFEPILFGITGAAVKIDELDPDVVGIGIGCLLAGVILRILATIGIAFGDKLNIKEKVFVALSWMAKATVQAALGPVCLKKLSENPEASDEDRRHGEIVLAICVLSIVLTAPIGAILISISGTKLLTKTKQPHITEGWRRSHRPSLYDISIIDEEEERDDPEKSDSNDNNKSQTQSTLLQPPQNSVVGRPLPVYTVVN